VVLSQPQHRGRRWHSRKKHGVQLQDSLGDQPWGSHRAGTRCAAEPELCPQVPVLSPATSLPNAWFSSSLRSRDRGAGRGAKAVPGTARALGFPKVGQRVAVTQAGPCCPDLPSPAPVTRSAPSRFQNSPAAMSASGDLHTFPVPAAERPLGGAGHLHPVVPHGAGTLGRPRPQRAPTHPWGTPCSFKGALPLHLIQEMSSWCS